MLEALLCFLQLFLSSLLYSAFHSITTLKISLSKPFDIKANHHVKHVLQVLHSFIIDKKGAAYQHAAPLSAKKGGEQLTTTVHLRAREKGLETMIKLPPTRS
ncbi:MAG: hypothetical protein GX096_15265 [Clostridiales bacterium]|nr:hypothetical protein [Clostridiales bacterium]